MGPLLPWGACQLAARTQLDGGEDATLVTLPVSLCPVDGVAPSSPCPSGGHG